MAPPLGSGAGAESVGGVDFLAGVVRSVEREVTFLGSTFFGSATFVPTRTTWATG